MHLHWTDIQDIAIALDAQHPDVDPQWVNFVDLKQWVCDLEAFDDNPDGCNERILEAIQANWIDEKD